MTMSASRLRFSGLLAIPLLAMAFGVAAQAADNAPPAAPAAPPSVKDALTLLRSAAPRTPEEREALRFDDAFRAAWQAVADAGEKALPEVRASLAGLKPVGGEDDFFRVLVGGLLWRVGGVGAAGEAAKVWSEKGLDLGVAPVIVHTIAYQAARTRDPKVLPLLLASFRETGGNVELPRENLTLAWPETVEYAWAAFGPQGRDELLKLLDTGKDDGQLASAAWLLARDGCVRALPALRRLAANAGPDWDHSRQTAISGLGMLGHPDDYAFLAQGFAAAIKGAEITPDADVFLDALVEYGDMRAAKPLLDYLGMLKSQVKYDDPGEGAADRLRLREMLIDLVDPAGLQRLRAETADLTGPERAAADALLANFFAAIGVPANEFDKLDLASQAQKLVEHRQAGEADFVLDAEAAKPTREVFTVAVDAMRRDGRLPFDRVMVNETDALTPAHLLAVGTAADIDLLLDARTVLARKLSGEALADMDQISAMVLRLARSEYRKEIGVCGQVTKK